MGNPPTGHHDHRVLRLRREAAAEHDAALLPRAPAAGEGIDLAGDGMVMSPVQLE